MVPKFSKKDIVNFNEETLYKEYKDYLDKDNDYLFKIFNSKDAGLMITEEEYIQFSRIYSNEIEHIKSRMDTVLEIGRAHV